MPDREMKVSLHNPPLFMNCSISGQLTSTSVIESNSRPADVSEVSSANIADNSFLSSRVTRLLVFKNSSYNKENILILLGNRAC